MSKFLIANGHLLNGNGVLSKDKKSLFVENQRITKIGDAQEIKHVADSVGKYEFIDATDLTVMPGLVDCHVHPSYGDILSFEELDLYAGVEFRTLRGALACQKILRAGITSFCAPGGTWNIDTALRDAINCGMIEGPRISAGGRYITTYNAIGSAWPTWMEHPKSSFAVLCNTRDEMITEVRKEVKEGVDVIKVAGDGDILNHASAWQSSLSSDDLKAIADMTHQLGKRCTIHARSGRVAAIAAEVGFDWVIHASFTTEEDIDTLIKHQTPINPTLSLIVNTIDWGPDLGVSDRIIDHYKRELEAASKGLTKAYEAGLMIMSGTDSGQGPVPYGEWHAREMEHLMTYLGMSSTDAIKAGTFNAAFALDMQNDIGTLEEGKFADILLVEGNPLEDISVLQDKNKLNVIMKDGQIVDTSKPLPERTVYAWEKPMLYWSDSRMPTQDFVRNHAKKKPEWMMSNTEAKPNLKLLNNEK